MKKSIVLAAIAAIVFSATSFAQITPKEWKASDKRVSQMIKLKQPKTSGVKSLDGLASEVNDLTVSAARISQALKTLQQTPDPAAILTLAEEITMEGLTYAVAVEKMTTVADDVKNINDPMQAMSAAGGVNYSQKALKLVGEESAFHGKVIKELTEAQKK